jgi:ParB-like chromosome segregation protein Spo0J
MKTKKTEQIENRTEVPVSELHYFEGNPKKATSKAFKKLLTSIKKIGIVEPVTVNTTTKTVLNGN